MTDKPTPTANMESHPTPRPSQRLIVTIAPRAMSAPHWLAQGGKDA